MLKSWPLSSWNAEDEADGDADSVRHATDRAEAEVFHLGPKYKSSAVIQDEIGATASPKGKCIGRASIA